MNNESYVSVELKGYLDGLRLIIDSDASIAEIESAIKQRLANLGDSDEEVASTPRLTSPSNEQPIRGIPANPPNAPIYQEPFSEEKEKAEFIRHTLRSGQVERFLEGNIIVIGDVNPGAEVTASGDIIILGNLRGIAHAGALGNIAAAVVAMNMEPTQLRIGNIITRPPSRKRRRKPMMEVARIKQGNVIVEDFEGF